MRDHLVADLMRHLADHLEFTLDHTPPPLDRRLEMLPLTLDVKRLLQWRWPRQPVRIGPYDIMPVEAILANDDLGRLLAAQCIPIGVARNGDLLVIRFREPQEAEVGLVSHDEFWEDPGLHPWEALTLVTPTVEEYLYRAAEGQFLPADSYSAQELQSMLDERK